MSTSITANGINFPNGSAGTPSVAGSDTDTGLFYGTDIVGFATGGSERLRIDASGNINIANDSGKLQLGASNDLKIYHNGTHSFIDNTTGHLVLQADEFRVYTGGGSKNFLKASDGGSLELYYNDSKKFETTTDGVQVTGEVVSGTLHCSGKLDLPDSSGATVGRVLLGDSDDLQLYHDGSNSKITNATGHLIITSDSLDINNAADNETLAKFDHDGAVELYYNGTKKLETTSGGVDISGSTDGVLNIDTTDGRGSFIRFKENGTSKCFVGCAEGLGAGDQDDLGLRTTDNIIFMIGSSQEFKISGTNGRLERSFGGGSGSGSDLDGMWFNNDQSTSGTYIRFWQTTSGANQIGSISHSTSATAYNTSSDYRLKENAVAISDGITRLKTLKPYRFNFKVTPKETVDGFFAHEVSSIVPEAITGTKDEVDSDNKPVYQGIDQSKLVPLLVAAVQELTVKVEALEAK